MPMLDMSAALTDPFLVDSFSVVRRQETVNNSGISTVTPATTTPVYGIVYPSDENDLRRLPDSDIFAKAITVITKFALRGESETEGTSFKPDLVVWNGDNFLVRLVDDYSNYGSGYIQAVCTSIDLVDAPPQG